MQYLRYLPLILFSVCSWGQEIPRSTEYTNTKTTRLLTTVMVTDPSIQDQSKKGVGVIRPEPWPENASFVEAKSLPFDGNIPAYPGDNGDFHDDNGRRVLAIPMQPGEKLVFNMTAEDAKVVMRCHITVPPPTLKWKLAQNMANQPFRSRRASNLKVQNPTSEIQVLYLMLYGVCGNSYRVDLVRNAGK